MARRLHSTEQAGSGLSGVVCRTEGAHHRHPIGAVGDHRGGIVLVDATDGHQWQPAPRPRMAQSFQSPRRSGIGLGGVVSENGK